MLTTLPGFLTRDRYGEIRLAGHRIGLLHVVDLHNQGLAPEAIHGEYPSLPVDLIARTIDFYLAHRPEVDDYASSTRAEIDRQAAEPSGGPTAAELRRRLGSGRTAATS